MYFYLLIFHHFLPFLKYHAFSPVPDFISLPPGRIIHRLHVFLKNINKFFFTISLAIKLLPCPEGMQIIPIAGLIQASKFVHQQIFSLIDYESNLLIALLLLSSKVIPPNMVLISFQHETWMHIS